MQDWSVNFLACPECGSSLDLVKLRVDDAGGAQEGVFVCTNPGCKAWFPIMRGVPRMMPESLRPDLTAEFIQTHHSVLVEMGLLDGQNQEASDDLHTLKKHTIQNFGFEWREFS